MKKAVLLLASISLLFLSGCCGCNSANWPEQTVVDHLNTVQKAKYLSEVKQTLINFRTTAADLQHHQPPRAAAEKQAVCHEGGFHCEVMRYVETYAKPILNDTEALQNLETRLEVAKVNLLGAYALYETGSHDKARRLLKMFDERYRKDVAIETAMLNSNEMEFATLGEGVRKLRAKLSN
jgi:hypothetical protein